jgi:hypothetical protein
MQITRKEKEFRLAELISSNIRNAIIVLVVSLMAAFLSQYWFSFKAEKESIGVQVLESKKALIV